MIHLLFHHGKVLFENDNDILSSQTISSLLELQNSLKAGQKLLSQYSVDDIIGFINAWIQTFSNRDSLIQKRFARYGINFLLYWFKEVHLKKILDISLHGNRKVLDDFCELSHSYRLAAFPKGIIAHWLAGNIPMLGILSLVQGIITKNANILKVSKKNGHIIPHLLNTMNDIVYHSQSGAIIKGADIVTSIAVLYFEADDISAQKALSSIANVRVAWGGLEAVESIMNTPRKYGCDDVIFGPKTSFMVIDKEMLDTAEQAQVLAKKTAQDVFALEQQGCNSPHTAFIEKGSIISAMQFCQLIANEMKKLEQTYTPLEIASADTMNVLTLRAEYDIRGVAWYSDGIQWSVLFSHDDTGLATPCYHRTLFVREIENIVNVLPYCSHLTQSVGMAVSPERKQEFMRKLMAKGVDRCPEIGTMTLYEIPWDGMFAIDRFVRWGKLS